MRHSRDRQQGEQAMLQRISRFGSPAALALALLLSEPAAPQAESMQSMASEDGIIKVRSGYAMGETVARLKKDIAGKGIRFFEEIDQSKLASDAGIALRPSTLLVFGNPPLGTQFITSNPFSGLDWPVRLLVIEDEQGRVWAAYTDFAYIAQRHHIRDREAQFKMASEVITSITSSVAAK
jgi:uncharacterized protein (DUF302 family)